MAVRLLGFGYVPRRQLPARHVNPNTCRASGLLLHLPSTAPPVHRTSRSPITSTPTSQLRHLHPRSTTCHRMDTHATQHPAAASVSSINSAGTTNVAFRAARFSPPQGGAHCCTAPAMHGMPAFILTSTAGPCSTFPSPPLSLPRPSPFPIRSLPRTCLFPAPIRSLGSVRSRFPLYRTMRSF